MLDTYLDTDDPTIGSMVCLVTIDQAHRRNPIDPRRGAIEIVRDRLEMLGHPVSTITTTRTARGYSVVVVRYEDDEPTTTTTTHQMRTTNEETTR